MISSDDLRLVESIARLGTLIAAASELKLHHATAYRRLGALEATLGRALFHRDRGAYRPTTLGLRACALAGSWRESVSAFESEVRKDLGPGSRLVVTTTEDVAAVLLPGWLTTFRRRHPSVEVNVLISNSLVALGLGEADVAVRPIRRAPHGLVGKQLGPLPSAVYTAARDAASDHWLGWTAGTGPRADVQWMERHVRDERVAMRFSTQSALHGAVRAGLGKAVLPCFVGDRDAALVRVGEPISALQSKLWLLCAPVLRGTPLQRAVFDTFTGMA